jgi:exopolysaccharide biosynthesis polyprenyl glycosylphosphotransferase
VFGDFLAFWISAAMLISVRYGHSSFLMQAERHVAPFIILYISWVLVFYLFGLYDLVNIKPTIPHFKAFGLALLACFGIGVFFFYFLPLFGISPKTNLLYQTALFGALSFVLRRVAYKLYSSQIVRPAVLVGNTPYLEELKTTLENNPQIGLTILAYTTDMSEALKTYANMRGGVFIFENSSNHMSPKDIMTLYENDIDLFDVAHAYEMYLYKIPSGYIAEQWIIDHVEIHRNVFYRIATRVMDIIISLCVLAVFSPLIILLSLMIKLSDNGRVFYTQKRVGKHGKEFMLYKFRTMSDNIATNPDANGESPLWQKVHDVRVTALGAVLRKLHIDELPQMVNVLRGDITLIGPRPERPEFVKVLSERIPNYAIRHIVKPGFTGWAQIRFGYARTEEDAKEKLEYDLYYIKNRNIFMDLGILIRTIQIIFTH